VLHRFLAIEGNIGAGKTSLCQQMAAQFDTRLILEQFADNPFLADFYQDSARHAFTVELFFMAERYKQLQDHLLEQDLFQQNTISDYFFIKTKLFAKRNLEGDEFRLFNRLFKILNNTFPNPDLLVYLHRPVEEVMRNIKKRGRDYERDITAEYLQNIQDAYFDFFKTEVKFPVLIIDISNKNFLTEEKVYDEIVGHINQKYEIGVHRVYL
jgi:deoxyguanosine kinase